MSADRRLGCSVREGLEAAAVAHFDNYDEDECATLARAVLKAMGYKRETEKTFELVRDVLNEPRRRPKHYERSRYVTEWSEWDESETL